MRSRETLRRHAGLVDNMATKIGVDLEAAALGGEISIDQISESVLRCSGCPNPDHCESLMQRSEGLEKTPEYCRNSDLFAKLIPEANK
ncbi:DUF6455 family protein [Ruegeria sp. HKCCA5491]|uniref:DUF6455 family protein n=1 Tax=Ruegeria sp. HKCCA5491 TaxID=2682986 RepID=UPI001488503B|nr:DUF6455 family protein [Ruegeria sp. HKCCA5491]